MPTTFHIHTRPRAHALQAPWGWVTRDPDAAGGTVAHWYDVLPSPGHHPGARVERYSRYKAVDARCRRRNRQQDRAHRQKAERIAGGDALARPDEWLGTRRMGAHKCPRCGR